jgi:hypothetical protein
MPAQRSEELGPLVVESPMLLIFGTAEGIGKPREIRQYQGE